MTVTDVEAEAPIAEIVKEIVTVNVTRAVGSPIEAVTIDAGAEAGARIAEREAEAAADTVLGMWTEIEMINMGTRTGNAVIAGMGSVQKVPAGAPAAVVVAVATIAMLILMLERGELVLLMAARIITEKDRQGPDHHLAALPFPPLLLMLLILLD